jgi:hypothetical protein
MLSPLGSGASFFERGAFAPGQEIGLSFEAQKTFPPKAPF